MKGIVFTEFLDLVGDRFGEEIVDRIIEESDLASGAAYTAVGTYDHAEIITLVSKLSAATQIPVPDLLRTYGSHLFHRFAEHYPHLFSGIGSCFDFLAQIDNYIHVEVRKLYPDAELPEIHCERKGDDRLELTYQSGRPLAYFAEGLIRGSVAHFGESVDVEMMDITADGTHARFELVRRPVQ